MQNDPKMRDINIAITAASYSGNKGAAAMLQSSIKQLHSRYGSRLNIKLMSVYPGEDRRQLPHDFVKVVPCKPERLLFIAFPLAILYRGLGWIPGVKRLLCKNKILRAYSETDLVIDEAGISFVDSRGFVMNTYAFVTMAVPMLMKVPVVKYSQAMGTFKNGWNRFLAKWILPKMKLICARGKGTLDNLAGIGIKDNVRLCADGAFTMEDDETIAKLVADATAKDAFFTTDVENKLIGLSVSSVVDSKCTKQGIDYRKSMVDFVDYLTDNGYKVMIIANAARIKSEKPRNNDLMVGDDIYSRVKNKDAVRWYHKEMDAEEIREYIGRCRFLVASRFHAMIGALQRKVPVLLIGWSHKYQEVLDMFGLGQYAIDFSKLELSSFIEEFKRFESAESEIRAKLDSENYGVVMDSSANNIRFISEIIDNVIAVPKKTNKLLDVQNPEKYMGTFVKCRMGYAADENIRANAASGGMITALLVNWLETGKIDGAWVSRTSFEDGKLTYKTFIATTKEEIMDCSSSVYMEMPLMKHIDILKAFNGKVAVVFTPCMMRAFNKLCENDPGLKAKVAIRLGLYCSGNHSDRATTFSMIKSGVDPKNAKRLYYRRGHWRGESTVIYNDGSEKNFSYTKTICAYKNAYFFEKPGCMFCQDHFANEADISFGDIWLKSMKSNPIKHTGCVIRNENALAMYEAAVKDGAVVERHMSSTEAIKSQKRALVFKFNAAKAKLKYIKSEEAKTALDTTSRCKWNHRLAFWLAEKNRAYSEQHPDKLMKKPMWLIYYYMCFIRVLLSF